MAQKPVGKPQSTKGSDKDKSKGKSKSIVQTDAKGGERKTKF